MADYVTIVGSVFFLAFGICAIIAGAFAAYFGSGKSRAVGGGLIVLGFVFLGLLYYLMTGYEATKGTWNLQSLYESIVALIGAGIGALVAVGVFLVAIMKA